MLKTSVLVVTLQSNFGAFIRDGLDPSQFDSYITSDFSDAVHFVRQSNNPMVILDAQLEDHELSVMDIGYGLRQLKSETQFIVVTRPGQDVDAETLAAIATLSMPVSITELTRLLKKTSTPARQRKGAETPESDTKKQIPAADAAASLVWLTDVSKAAQQLTQLTLESAAQAAFITRKNELWAYAGQLSREAAQELTGTIQRYWDSSGQSDLLRFVRLKATEAQHMLYVRRLSEEMTLALVFDAETPFSTIRAQAGKLVKNLFDNSNASGPAQPQADPGITRNFSAEDQPDNGEFPGMPPISDVLGEVPPPIPNLSALTSALPWEKPAPSERRPVSEPVRARTTASQLKPAPQLKPVSQPVSPLNRVEQAPNRPAPSNAETAVSTPTRAAVPHAPQDLEVTRKQDGAFDPQSVIETRVQPNGEATPDVGGHRILIESPSMTQVNLSYACVLIPRFEQHYLVGDVAARLNEWLPQLCVAFGWRLEYISVRPDYLQWIARVHLNTAAGYVIKIIRQHTSDRMFAEFPRLKIENPSGEFWAHGFVVHGGSQPHPQQAIRNFIAQTRVRQGLR